MQFATDKLYYCKGKVCSIDVAYYNYCHLKDFFFQLFHTDDFEVLALQNGYCPFCRKSNEDEDSSSENQ